MSKDFARQSWIGLTLAGALIAAWVALHVFAVWRLDAVGHPFTALACLLGLTWLSTGLFIVAHDAMHGSLAPAWPKINVAVGALALRLYAGFSFRRLVVKHRLHHLAPGTDDDPDFARAGPLLWYLAFMRRYFGWREFLTVTAAVIAYQWLLGDRWPYVAFWSIPSILASFQLFWFGTYLPHRPGPEPFVDRHNARSPRMSAGASLLTCFHFGGRHHEHHLFPGLPWWRLPAAPAERTRA
ncbi:beta-carotene ketolase (CrtW type) [Rhodoblastus acidophilus]|uniref:fatty acid desaturase n=1 Tax=Rhodoblastus acidophilus TaxID=1074 RepID=UPI0022244D2F|nr:fatty acid desaturase [Rhodoblastus acidophilus]MCW2317361.1 beta-carotene ketolase (CrtW type) [Rhodoblastus acidophilus]